MRVRRASVPPEGLLRRRALGCDAVYRVLETSPATVEVEVVRAPGLERGARLRFTADAARAMEPVALSVIPPEGRGTPAIVAAGR